MDLRKTREHRRLFDGIFIFLSVLGLATVWFSFREGGFWYVFGVFSIFCLMLLFYAIFIEPKRINVVTYREALCREPSVWFKIVFLSDLHAGQYADQRYFKNVAKETQALNPDVLLLGGDYVVDQFEYIEQLKPLADLSTELGKFFVMGNHDYMDKPQEIRSRLLSFGYRDLTNNKVILEREGKKIEVQGIDDVWMGKPLGFKRTSGNIPHITLTHEPDLLLDLKEGETDLFLTGHTHGGHVNLPFIGSLWPVPTKMKRVLVSGKRTVNGIKCIVSNGLGEGDSRARLFATPQIVVVEVGI